MLLVIFGAGASHDSGSLSTVDELRGIQRPPLAAELVHPRFDGLAAQLPQCRPIVDLLRARMTADSTDSLEAALARIVERSSGSIERRRQLIAFRFHLLRVIADTVDGEWLRSTEGFTHYLRLLNYLLDWQKRTGKRVLLVTFNYDTLLDTAASDVVTGWNLDQLGAYLRPDFRLFKLHGSTAWSRVLVEPGFAGTAMVEALMTGADRLDPQIGRIEAHPPWEMVGMDDKLTLPAMAIPMADKTDFECPADHLAALKQDLPEVEQVLIIGWRAAEPHAVELLRAGLRRHFRLGIVTKGAEGLNELRGNLGQLYDGGNQCFVEQEGFSEFIKRADEHLVSLLGLLDT